MRPETQSHLIKITGLASISPLLLFELALLLGPTVVFTPSLTLHDQQRIEQIVLLCLLIMGGFFVWRGELLEIRSRMPRWVSLLLAFGLGLGLVSVTRAEFPRYAGLEWASFFLLGWCAVLLGGQSYREGVSFDRWATRVAVLAVIFISLKAMLNYANALFWGTPDTTKLFSQSFGNPRFFGQAASMLLPILASPLLSITNSKLKTTGTFLLLAILWMLAIASGTRGTWLAMLVAAATLSLVSWQASKPWLKVQLTACLAGLGLFAVFFLWLPHLWLPEGAGIVDSRLNDIATLSKRDIIWNIAWQQIQEHPWLGIGPMQFAAIRNPIAAHPHNALLQLGAEWGLPATLALVAPLIYAMFALLSRIREGQNDSNIPLLVCLGASLLAAITQSMVDGVIVMPYSQILLVFISGWALGLYYRGQDACARSSTSKTTQRVSYLLPVLALGLLLFGVFPEILSRAEVTQKLISEGVTLVQPRFWVQGWIP
jgi:putative inorganic carbon (HCO3(-)) transporter